MSSLELFQWFYATPIAETIRNSTWLFPVIEAFHLLGLGLTVGSVLLVELRVCEKAVPALEKGAVLR